VSGIAKYALENPNAIKNFSSDIRKLLKTAAAETVNGVAFDARANIKEAVNAEFIIRNSFTTSGKALFVTKVPYGHTENLGDIEASVGFTEKAAYMERQDAGGTREGRNGNGVPIPMDRARKGGKKTGVVQKKYYLSDLKDLKVKGSFKKTYRLEGGDPWNGKREQKHEKGKTGMPKAAGVARAAVAAREGKLIHYGENLFAVTDFKAQGNVHFEIVPVYFFEYREIKTQPTHFFLPACEKAIAEIQERFNENMDKALA
jgi:hypothetical protein